jgi:hypothetical protein
MIHVLLDTQQLRRYDERALDVLYRSIEKLQKKRLTRHEVFRIYNEGVRIAFAGHGLNYAPELNYALFYSRVRALSPLLMTVKCFALRGESHAEVIQQGSPGKLIVAGTVRNRTFTGVSTTWRKGIQPDSGQHSFGLFMNDLLLDHYGIEREPGWSDGSDQIWSFA